MVKTVLFLLLLCPVAGWAQAVQITPQDTQRKQSFLLMRDGSVVRGQILRQDSTIITVRKRGGDLSFVEADQLLRITPVRPGETAAPADRAGAGGPVRSAIPTTVFVMKDSSRVEGRFVRRDSTMITVRKRNGQLTYFEPELLVRVDSVRQETTVGVRPTYLTRFSPWLLTGQTAHTAESGRLYYRNTLLVLNEVNYGITRNWSIGASVNPLFSVIDYGYNNPREVVLSAVARFSTKLSFPIGDQFRFGVSTTYRPRQKANLYRLDGQWTIQGLATFGDHQRNATLGYGQDRYQNQYPIRSSFVTVGVMHKLSRSLTFVSDNTFYISSLFLQTNLSAAFRLDRRRHAFDLGALAVVYPYYYSGSRALFSPYVGYNLLIGRD